MADRISSIPISAIIEPSMMLRLVNRDSIEYLEMRDSLREHGFLNSILVRPSKVPGKYEIIDGLHRFTISKELNFDSIPCIVKEDVDDDTFLAMQLEAQACRPKNPPAAFANQLKKLLTRRPELTLDELSHLVRKSPHWLSTVLGMLRLPKDIQKMVDRGEIVMRSAYELSKIPPRLQRQYVDAARAMPVKQFKALAASVVKQFGEAVKQGRMQAFWENKFTPHAHLRPLKAIQEEIDSRNVGALVVMSEDCKTPLDGFYAALRWAIHLDRNSVAEQEALALGRKR